MTFRAATRRITSATLALAMVVLGGCAGLPRIDPSGQRFLIWPGEPAPVPTAPGTVPIATTPPAPTFASPPPGNVLASPVYTDPFQPGAGPATATPAIGPSASRTALNQPRPGALTITPQRLLAPVGSEVVLRANLCATDGYLQANRRVEWMVDRRGVGEIVTIGQRGESDFTRFPWQNPKKVDNYYAVGTTSPFYQCIDRGTPDTSDDLQVRRGDAWISVMSPVEGTSYVSAYMPSVENWNDRTARATIYWVDAEWTFPATVTLAPGERHTLTTTVTRQSDGTPLAGWIVKYVVQGGRASLGYDAGGTSEVRTDANGRASVEITPTDSAPGTTSVAIEVVRPEQTTTESSPRVTLGSGVTTLTWAGGGMAGTPLPPAGTAPGSPIFTPPTGSLPPANTNPSSPANPPASTLRPDLDLQAAAVEAAPHQVGGIVRFDASLVNRGNAPARISRIIVEFDPGLRHAAARAGEPYIKIETPFALGPGESETLPPLEFQAVGSGRQCINIKIESDAPVSPVERVCVDVVEAPAPSRPTLSVVVEGPRRRTVGEIAEYKIIVRNTGTVAAENVIVVNQADPAMNPVQSAPPIGRLPNGALSWNLGTLAPNARQEFLLNCECKSPTTQAINRVEVRANPDVIVYGQSQEACEIVPQVGGGLGTAPATRPAETGVPVTMSLSGRQRVGTNSVLYARVENKTNQTQRNVAMWVLIPPQFEASVQNIVSENQAEFRTTPEGLELRFAPAAELAPGASISASITLSAIGRGQTTLHARRTAEGLDPLVESLPVEVLDRL